MAASATAKDAKDEMHIRRRNVAVKETIEEERDVQTMPKQTESEHTSNLATGTYWLTRIVILRFLGFIYCKFNGCSLVDLTCSREGRLLICRPHDTIHPPYRRQYP